MDTDVLADGYQQDLEVIDPTAWTRFYDPVRSSPGYNLVLYRRRLPMLLDMNGHIVHAWPGVRAVGRARLDRRGHLVVIGRDNLIKEYDWEGNLLRYFRPQQSEDFPHHDVIEQGNGNLLAPVREDKTRTDTLVEISPRSKVVWEWRALDHRHAFPTWDAASDDPTHINSVFELPPNRWFDEGDDRFRPGNILVSARDLNTVFVVDRQTGNVVWQYSTGLDHQHEASMGRPGGPWGGLILVFDNGRDSVNAYRRSTIRAIDPVHAREVWQYSSEYFFSSVGGTQQELPGGNFLVTSSHGGRAFEITPSGETVWEWTPPYLPMRVERLPYDHCPQLAGLTPGPGIAVDRTGGLPFVDEELFAFSLAEERVTRVVDGVERHVVPVTDGCRSLLVPPEAGLTAEYGLDRERLAGRDVHGHFLMSLEGAGFTVVAVDDTVDSGSQELWRKQRTSLVDMALQRVEMCLSVTTKEASSAAAGEAVWGLPRIRSNSQQPSPLAVQPLHGKEEKLRRRQLEALGYVE